MSCLDTYCVVKMHVMIVKALLSLSLAISLLKRTNYRTPGLGRMSLCNAQRSRGAIYDSQTTEERKKTVRPKDISAPSGLSIFILKDKPL